MADETKIVPDYETPPLATERANKLLSNQQARMLSCAVLIAGSMIGGAISQRDPTTFAIGGILSIVFLVDLLRSYSR